MRSRRKYTTDIGPNDYSPLVSLIKPVCGLEKNLYANLVTACRQNYPEYEVIFTVLSSSDPALTVIDKISADFSEKK